MRAIRSEWVVLFTLVLVVGEGWAGEAEDLGAARELFARNIRAIQDRDREAYLACYLDSERLVRSGYGGLQLGYKDLAGSTPEQGGDQWPEELLASDLRLSWVGDGVVYGTYRYQVVIAGQATSGISERLFVRQAAGFRIVITTAFEAPAGTPPAPVALVGATVYTGDGAERIEDAVLVLRNGKIESVGTGPAPEGVEQLDVSGRYLIPGLIDTHVHYSQTGWADGRPDALDLRDQYPYEQTMAENRRHPERFHRAFLYSGVTAVFDVGGYPWTRDLMAATEQSTVAPHVVATGPLLSTMVPPQLTLADQSQFVLMEDEESLRRAVRSHAAQGSAAIKIWMVLSDPDRLEEFIDQARIVSDEASRLELPVVVHATELESARGAVEAGAHLLVHSVQDRPVDADFINSAVASGVYYCPTLIVGAGYLDLYARRITPELEQQLDQVDATVRERLLATRKLGRDARFNAAASLRIGQRQERQKQVMYDNLRRLHQAGVPIVMGTDAGNPLTLHGPSVFVELEAMQEAGLSPLEVLTAATRDAARALGREADLGLLLPGYIADLVVLEEDPAEDIAHVRSIQKVVRGGRVHERKRLKP